MPKETTVTKEEYLQLARVWVFDQYRTVTNGALKLGISRVTLTNALKGDTPMPGTIRNALGFVENKPTYTKRVK